MFHTVRRVMESDGHRNQQARAISAMICSMHRNGSFLTNTTAISKYDGESLSLLKISPTVLRSRVRDAVSHQSQYNGVLEVSERNRK